MGSQTGLNPPDYDLIRRETGPVTEDAIQTIFQNISAILLRLNASNLPSTGPPIITYSGTTSGILDLNSGPLQLLTAGTWTIMVSFPINVRVAMISGGGGGGTDTGGNGAAGGGGGAYVTNQTFTLVPGRTYTVVVGAGTGNAPSGSPGANGGNSTFVDTTGALTLLSLSGGHGGNLGVVGAAGTVVVGTGTPGVAGHARVPPDGGAGGDSGAGSGGGVGGSGGGTGGPGGDATANGGGGGGGNGNAAYVGGAGFFGYFIMALA